MIVYLALSALQGDHGLFSLFRIEAEESEARAELDTLRANRAIIAGKTARLSGDGRLDLDLLDERSRSVLGLAKPNEIIIR